MLSRTTLPSTVMSCENLVRSLKIHPASLKRSWVLTGMLVGSTMQKKEFTETSSRLFFCSIRKDGAEFSWNAGGHQSHDTAFGLFLLP
jgi:hypothetical protein